MFCLNGLPIGSSCNVRGWQLGIGNRRMRLLIPDRKRMFAFDCLRIVCTHSLACGLVKSATSSRFNVQMEGATRPVSLF